MGDCMKKIYLLFFVSLLITKVFCVDLSNCFDSAKQRYLDGKYIESKVILEKIEKELLYLDEINGVFERKTVNLENLLRFPEEYAKQKFLFKIDNVLIDTNKVIKSEDYDKYIIEVSDEKQTYISDIANKENNRFVFLIDFELLEELISCVDENGVGYVNIHLGEIGFIKKKHFLNSQKYYFAEIIEIEILNSNKVISLAVCE